jgi:hypothetical protein
LERNDMGGMGSGRRYQSGKRTTDDYRKLDVRRLHRDGLLTPGQSFGWNWSRHGETVASIQIRTEADRVILGYRSRSHCGEWQQMEYPVYLEWSGCTLGGRRAWFLCPGRGCGRRVAILYGGSVFACRHCHKLAYECQREPSDHRAIRRADTIRARLGWHPGIAFPIGDKPKGMHWRTYLRLMNQYRNFVQSSWVGSAHRLGLLEDRVNGLHRYPS